MLPDTMRALDEQGDLDVIQVREDVPLPQLQDGQVLVKVEYAGCNFIDSYQRSGTYKINLPSGLGNEIAGTVVQLGPGVDAATAGFQAYIALGGFAQYARAPAIRTIKLPSSMTTRDAATVLLQGLTALTFITEAHKVEKGHHVLVHAAAGGLGLLLCQLCSHRGATVIGTASTQDKADLAKANGAAHVILYRDVPMDHVAEQVKSLTPAGDGVEAVFDGVGKDTFDCSLSALKRKGSMVSIGNASGTVPPVSILTLGPRCLSLRRPILTGYVQTREEFAAYAKELFELVEAGAIRLSVHKEYELTTEGVRQAQRDITGRGTTGKLIVRVA